MYLTLVSVSLSLSHSLSLSLSLLLFSLCLSRSLVCCSRLYLAPTFLDPEFMWGLYCFLSVSLHFSLPLPLRLSFLSLSLSLSPALVPSLQLAFVTQLTCGFFSAVFL